MTENEAREMLINIDKGYTPTYTERRELASIKRFALYCRKKIPNSIKLLLNVEELSLSGSDIVNISVLSKCKSLSTLDMSGITNLSDISALSDLPNLHNLYLDGTNVIDLSALSSLTALTSLNLSDPFYTDYFHNNLYEDINSEMKSDEWEGNYNLRFLMPRHINQMYLYSVLWNDLPSELEKRRLNNIDALSNLINLKSLRLAGTEVCDISILSGLRQLVLQLIAKSIKVHHRLLL